MAEGRPAGCSAWTRTPSTRSGRTLPAEPTQGPASREDRASLRRPSLSFWPGPAQAWRSREPRDWRCRGNGRASSAAHDARCRPRPHSGGHLVCRSRPSHACRFGQWVRLASPRPGNQPKAPARQWRERLGVVMGGHQNAIPTGSEHCRQPRFTCGQRGLRPWRPLRLLMLELLKGAVVAAWAASFASAGWRLLQLRIYLLLLHKMSPYVILSIEQGCKDAWGANGCVPAGVRRRRGGRHTE